jgi:hypothetical protein
MKTELNQKITEFIADIDAALEKVAHLVYGNTLFADGSNVSAQGKAEAKDALWQFADYIAALNGQKAKANALLQVEMPPLPPQFASQEVIDEFVKFVGDLAKTVAQYQPPVAVPLEITIEPADDVVG